MDCKNVVDEEAVVCCADRNDADVAIFELVSLLLLCLARVEIVRLALGVIHIVVLRWTGIADTFAGVCTVPQKKETKTRGNVLRQ